MKQIDNFKSIVDKYDIVFFDAFGVIKTYQGLRKLLSTSNQKTRNIILLPTMHHAARCNWLKVITVTASPQ